MNRRIPILFTELVTTLDPLVSIPKVNLLYGECKITVKIKTVDKNGNDIYVTLGTDEALYR